MKRCAALVQLSREHHPALVLAQRAQRLNLADKAAALKFMGQTSATFSRELEPHFQLEEARLLPALNDAGETELVKRTLEEHAELRELADQLKAGDASRLSLFGAALERHVRFEERELFEVAESVLSAEALKALCETPRGDSAHI